MGKVSLDMSMSLDGFIAGPNGQPEGRLHQWYFSPSGGVTGSAQVITVSDGIESAIKQAKAAAGDKLVTVGAAQMSPGSA